MFQPSRLIVLCLLLVGCGHHSDSPPGPTAFTPYVGTYSAVITQCSGGYATQGAFVGYTSTLHLDRNGVLNWVDLAGNPVTLHLVQFDATRFYSDRPLGGGLNEHAQYTFAVSGGSGSIYLTVGSTNSETDALTRTSNG